MINLEISKGMYIRFNGFISKIGHINTSKKGNTYVQFKQPNGLLAHTRIENIDRASFNIIDLIEVGDYVNGYEIIEKPYCYHEVYFISINSHESWGWGIGEMPITKIKTIVTKEQFNLMKYVIERDK